MAFDLRHFQFNRGVNTTAAQGQGFTPVLHTYKSATDTKATISAADYFPPYIDGDIEKVFIGDALFIVASDGTALCMFTSVGPVVLGMDLLVSGTSLAMAAPIAPIDNNGAVISGSTLALEFASAAHPGIVSVAGQAFTGIKNFQDGINVFGQGVSTDFIDATSGSNPIEVGATFGTAVNVRIPTNAIGGLTVGTPGGATLSTFDSFSGSISWSGPFVAPVAGKFFMQRFNDIVYLYVRTIANSACNAASAIIGGTLPVAFRPPQAQFGLAYINNNGTSAVGEFQISAGGNIAIFAGLNSETFANTGSSYFQDFSVSYSAIL